MTRRNADESAYMKVRTINKRIGNQKGNSTEIPHHA